MDTPPPPPQKNSVAAMSNENMQHEITILWVGNGSF